MSFERQRPPLGEHGFATWIRWQFRLGLLTRGEWETLARIHYAYVRRCPTDADRLDELSERRFMRQARQTFAAWPTDVELEIESPHLDLTAATAAGSRTADVPATDLGAHRRQKEANTSETEQPTDSFMSASRLPAEFEAAISDATGVPRHELDITVYDPTRDLQTEWELAEMILDTAVEELCGPGHDYSTFDRLVDRFLDTLDARIVWWRDRQAYASTPRTIGWTLFETYIESLEFLKSATPRLRAMKGVELQEEIAAIVVLGLRKPLEPPGGGMQEQEDFAQSIMYGLGVLRRMLLLQEVQLDLFVPLRDSADS